ncbi:MAG: glycosyltransferase family 4 protein [Actinomycetota bacterium]|nr:glycosyltransferase family 4 protein [Actinomycetota bacterium]
MSPVAPLPVAVDLTHARLNRTGIGRYAAELFPALQARKTLRAIPVAAVDRAPHTSVRRIAEGLLREGVYYPVGLANLARRSGAHVIHAPTPAAIISGRLPLVVTVMDLLPLRHPELFTHQTRAHTALHRHFVRHAQQIITPSEATRHDVIDLLGVPEERVTAVALGVAARFAPRDIDPERLREHFGIRAPYVLCVGTLEPRKNLATVLRAFRIAAAQMPDAQLVITGGRGWRNEAFEAELGAASKEVRLTGFVTDDELAELYAGAACFVFPSLAEGFGFPPLEAMACGAPVVTSDRSALPEVTGNAALLVDPEDAEAVAGAIVEVLVNSSLAADLRRRGLERSARFTWAATAMATESVYRDAVAGAGGGK